MKASYLSTVFATRVEERNLIYIAPLLFIGTALVFSRRRVSWVGLTVAGAYVLYLVGYALYHVTQYPSNAIAFSSSGYLDVSVPRVCLQYPMYSGKDSILLKIEGFPIRKSLDQSLLTAPQSISVLVPSFIGS